MNGNNAEDVKKLVNNLVEERDDMQRRLNHINHWLETVGRWVHAAKDKELRASFMQEKLDLTKDIAKVKEQISAAHEGLRWADKQSGLNRVVQHGLNDLNPRVSDHALVRWLERHHNLNVEEMKNDMYQDMVRSATVNGQDALKKSNGSSMRVVSGALIYVVNPKDRTIITCYRDTETMTGG